MSYLSLREVEPTPEALAAAQEAAREPYCDGVGGAIASLMGPNGKIGVRLFFDKTGRATKMVVHDAQSGAESVTHEIVFTYKR